jgi:hypothetical protein
MGNKNEIRWETMIKELKSMKEYTIRLGIEPYQIIILAVDFTEAQEIAYERWGKYNVISIEYFPIMGDLKDY